MEHFRPWSPDSARACSNSSSWDRSYLLRFNELSRLIEPGKEPKTDKNSILSDAVRYVQSLNCQNHQLKQLNKFLEVGQTGSGLNLMRQRYHAGHAAGQRLSTSWPRRTAMLALPVRVPMCSLGHASGKLQTIEISIASKSPVRLTRGCPSWQPVKALGLKLCRGRQSWPHMPSVLHPLCNRDPHRPSVPRAPTGARLPLRAQAGRGPLPAEPGHDARQRQQPRGQQRHGPGTAAAAFQPVRRRSLR